MPARLPSCNVGGASCAPVHVLYPLGRIAEPALPWNGAGSICLLADELLPPFNHVGVGILPTVMGRPCRGKAAILQWLCHGVIAEPALPWNGAGSIFDLLADQHCPVKELDLIAAI